MGRPKIDVQWEIVDTACAFNAEMQQILNLLSLNGYHMSHDTLERKIFEREQCTFAEYRSKRLEDTRLKLQQKALAMAMGGHAALMIFCLKNLCKWSDNVREEITVKADEPKTVVVYKTSWGSTQEIEQK